MEIRIKIDWKPINFIKGFIGSFKKRTCACCGKTKTRRQDRILAVCGVCYDCY